MNIGSIIGNGLLIIFGLFAIGVVGYLFYMLFIALKRYINVNQKQTNQKKQIKQEPVTKGIYCSKCGSLNDLKNKFCMDCGEQLK